MVILVIIHKIINYIILNRQLFKLNNYLRKYSIHPPHLRIRFALHTNYRGCYRFIIFKPVHDRSKLFIERNQLKYQREFNLRLKFYSNIIKMNFISCIIIIVIMY